MFSNKKNVLCVVNAVNKMPFCQLEEKDDKRRSTIKG